MALAATSFVAQGMTSLDTIRAIRMATKLAWKAGWDRNATKVCNLIFEVCEIYLFDFNSFV